MRINRGNLNIEIWSKRRLVSGSQRLSISERLKWHLYKLIKSKKPRDSVHKTVSES
jgi:hypothetical protein